MCIFSFLILSDDPVEPQLLTGKLHFSFQRISMLTTIFWYFNGYKILKSFSKFLLRCWNCPDRFLSLNDLDCFNITDNVYDRQIQCNISAKKNPMIHCSSLRRIFLQVLKNTLKNTIFPMMVFRFFKKSFWSSVFHLQHNCWTSTELCLH